MSLPAMAHTDPAINTAPRITNPAQASLMGFGLHFLSLATKTNVVLHPSSTTKTQAK